ncbi:hypothetical protein BU26DRAFT_552017 [Trematosphaeria pertusa]|uniref:Uncharacterized protein n=1 Tax=Trematosphaeria pertusa TaxID=390896 RepID=A0A6A6I9Y3_9PLEO|nr:uncharacterized protein BU26DRAFT_552017 [Trematosphaeria pertusa]KAF2247186.1 hypothetical protein BU26DRAFT_552017 [Trematosphaeria pertusa]
MYIPDGGAHGSTAEILRTNSFVSVLPLLYVRDEALRLALLAVGTAAMGKGKNLYGQGLQEMGRALRDEKRARSEALLVAPRFMGMFEILFGANVDPNLQARSWRSHAEGELALMKSRGPGAFREGIAHQIFVEGRMVPIIAGVRMRRRTLLNEPEWKTIPRSKHPKTPKDTLLDVLADIPEVMEYADLLSSSSSSSSSSSGVGNDESRRNAIAKCQRLDAE